MKRIIFISALFLLSACVPHWADYQPKLAVQPKNMAKYEANRKYCLNDAIHRKNKSDPLVDADAWKTPRQMVDECVAAKGYDVVKVSHCC